MFTNLTKQARTKQYLRHYLYIYFILDYKSYMPPGFEIMQYTKNTDANIIPENHILSSVEKKLFCPYL